MPRKRRTSHRAEGHVIEANPNRKHIKEIDLSADIERERTTSRQFRETFDLVRDATIIARQLHDLREKRGLSQTQVADLAGTSQQVISRLEHPGYQSHSLSMLRRVVSALEGHLLVYIEG